MPISIENFKFIYMVCIDVFLKLLREGLPFFRILFPYSLIIKFSSIHNFWTSLCTLAIVYQFAFVNSKNISKLEICSFGSD